MAEPTDAKQLTIFITGAGQGAGLATVQLATRAGHKVVGSTELGSKGAYRIRRAGGLPVYPDLTRQEAIYSALQMSQADVIINAAPQVVNGMPQHVLDYDDVLAWLEASTSAIMTAAGRAEIDRIIHLSAATIYGDTHHDAVAEDGHLTLDNKLGASLHEAEETVLDGGVPAYILRTGYIMGTHEAGEGVANALRNGKGIPNGKHHTAWAHEDDVASAALAIAEKTEDEEHTTIYNIASTENLTPDEVMHKFGAQFGTGDPSPLADFLLQLRTSAIQRYLMSIGTLLDTSKAQADLNWSPKGSIDGAIDKMLLVWRSEEAQVTVYHQEEDSQTTGIVKA
ncbi:MAG: NAD(P)-dependent oxidoreductase [Chloroflexota bacterium]